MTIWARTIRSGRSMSLSMSLIWPKLGFGGVEPEATGRPAYHPATLLKIYVYGYLNRGRAGIAEFGGSDQALIRRQSRCKRKANAGFQPLPHAWLVGQASAFRQGQTLSLDC